MSYVLGPQDLSWTSASRIFATTAELFDSMPNYEHEVAMALDTRIKYQGSAPVVGGWRFADGQVVPGQPPVAVPSICDQFTILRLEFEGLEGSTTLEDTNCAVWPRTWRRERTIGGFGTITNVGEQVFPISTGYLKLDGKTIYTAPDDDRIDFAWDNFTVRMRFRVDEPLGIRRTLVSKGNQRGRWTFFVDHLNTGEMIVHSDTIENAEPDLYDRFKNVIQTRDGQDIWTRESAFFDYFARDLQSTTIYSDTINPGWHTLAYKRTGTTLSLVMDGVVEDTTSIVSVYEPVRGDRFPFGYEDVGPITIGGYGPRVVGYDQNDPFVGGLDRFAVDIGIAR
jgi:hypothetical protein